MKKQLQKKFNAYQQAGMAFIIMMMFSIVTVNAQIVYTDVIPDTTINTNNGVYNLDLNNDSIIDFNINYFSSVVTGSCGSSANPTNLLISVTPQGANEVGRGLSNILPFPSALSLNEPIDSSSFTWLNTGSQLMSNRNWICWGGSPMNPNPYWTDQNNGYWTLWNAPVNKYLPLRLHVGSQQYYGWIHLNVAMLTASFTAQDYAYNSIPSQPILAGQTTTTGIKENSFASSIKLFPNPATDHLTIDLGSNNKKVVHKDSYGEVTIADITGKVIFVTKATDTQKIEVNTNEFAEGLYTLQIQTADFIVKKKLLIEK
jgi:hypothetical protein